jgi:hypothetical protein
VKAIYRLFITLWGILKNFGTFILCLLIITFPFIITDNWIYRVIIIIGGLLIINVVSFLIRDKEDERYFLVIPLKIHEAMLLFMAWIHKEGFSIAEEHSVDWYEVFSNGKQDKILSFCTHGPGIEQFKEHGISVSKEEIKRRDYFSNEDYIEGLGFPLEIHKKSIRKIIKNALGKERTIFCKL